MPVETLKFKARAAQSADAALVRAETRVINLLALLTLMSETERLAGAEHRVIDDLCATVEWIRNAEPESLLGAAVKLRVLLHPEIADAHSPDDDRASLRQVLGALEKELAAQHAKRPTARKVA
jgi:hypothetical protein